MNNTSVADKEWRKSKENVLYPSSELLEKECHHIHTTYSLYFAMNLKATFT